MSESRNITDGVLTRELDAMASVAHKIFTCVVVGSIGAGKTNLCERMKGAAGKGAFECVRVVVVPEPVAVWQQCGGFDNFMANPRLYGALFQHLAFNTRIQTWIKLWRTEVASAALDPDVNLVVVVLERSPMCDKLLFADQMLADGVFDDREYALYIDWFTYANSRAPAHIDLYIDVHTPFDETVLRIEQRAQEDASRAGERGYDLGYLRRSYDRQREIFDQALYGSDTPVLHVDGLLPFHTDDGTLSNIMKRVSLAGDRAAMHRSMGDSQELLPPAGEKPRTPSPKLTEPLGRDFYDFVRGSICRCAQCGPPTETTRGLVL